MALNEFFSHFFGKFKGIETNNKHYKILNWNYFIYFILITLFFIVFIFSLNLKNQKTKKESQNLGLVVQNQEFSNLTNYFWSKIKSPYHEIEYLIKNNDSVEKILKNLKVNANDIKIISEKLKKEKLTNIYAGKKLNIVLKKLIMKKIL